MDSKLTVAALAAALIRVFEGLHLIAYRDSGGVLTIGYGHTGADVIEGMVITEGQAEALLATDQRGLFALVAERPLIEAAALVSFGYNCGIGALEKVLNGYSFPTQFVHDHHGTTQPGLVARRNLEEALMEASLQQQVVRPVSGTNDAGGIPSGPAGVW